MFYPSGRGDEVYFPHLTLAEATRDAARRAAQLRAIYSLRPADALQVAAALLHGATAFVTNDRFLTRLSAVLDVVFLDDLRYKSPCMLLCTFVSWW